MYKIKYKKLNSLFVEYCNQYSNTGWRTKNRPRSESMLVKTGYTDCGRGNRDLDSAK